MARDIFLIAFVILFILFEIWGHKVEKKIEKWAKGPDA